MLPLENRAELLKIVCDAAQKFPRLCTDASCNEMGSCEFAQHMVAEMMDKNATVEQHGHLKHSPGENIAICSVCGGEIYLGSYHQFAHNGCPNCLAVLDEPPEWEREE